MLFRCMLLLLVSSVVDIPSILVFPLLLAFILLLASLLCGWHSCCFSVHGVVGVSAVVIFLLKSLRKKREAVFLNF
jgi:cell division protein FtsW (lipid II flippase)